jgi:hypothetical protein
MVDISSKEAPVSALSSEPTLNSRADENGACAATLQNPGPVDSLKEGNGFEAAVLPDFVALLPSIHPFLSAPQFALLLSRRSRRGFQIPQSTVYA